MSRSATASAVLGAVLATALLGATTAGAPASAAATSVVPCSRGLVALTFDDGPRAPITQRLVDLLANRRVPATLFVLGSRVEAAPGIVRRAERAGLVIANHTYGHELLTGLGSRAIRRTFVHTRQALRAAGVQPSRLVRPPYGAVDDRVRAVVRDLGMVSVLWTVDPRDWDGRSATEITRATLAGLRPHETNVVLLHDGVDSSDRTLAALPAIVRGARTRGYCFAALGSQGAPVPPVPVVGVTGVSVTEGPGGSVAAVRVTLDRPTARRTSVRLRTPSGSATAGADYVGVDTRLVFPVGTTERTVRIRVRDDLRDEAAQRFGLQLSHPRGQQLGRWRGGVWILDDDPPPQVRVDSATVTEPEQGTAVVPVAVSLRRASERWVSVTVRTVAGTADATDYVALERVVRFAPGARLATVEVTVLADEVAEEPESFAVTAVSGVNADVADAMATVTILPPAE